ncbi:hypothetical protein KKG58_01095 [Patescibacteria group bacterium]|nr:hypothetical protein [Patescibacteria group bacterium]
MENFKNLTGLTPEEKKAINKEGFENVNGTEGALLIGSKEEVERQRKILETEGQTTDLATYIKMHKKIVIPNDYEPKNYKGNFNKEQTEEFLELVKNVPKGFCWEGYRSSLSSEDEKKWNVSFIDNHKNLAEILIDGKKINSFKNNLYRISSNQIRMELYDLGFHPTKRNSIDSIEITNGEFLKKKNGEEILVKEMVNGFECLKMMRQKELEQEAEQQKHKEFDF